MKKIYIWLVLTFFAVCGLPNCTLVSPVLAQEPFSSYQTFISWRDEKIYLDNFEIYLKKKPTMLGYMVFYVGKKDKVEIVQKRIAKSRNYLIKTGKIDKSRLRVICVRRNSNVSTTVFHLIDMSSPPPDFEGLCTISTVGR